MARIRPYETQTSVQTDVPGRNAGLSDFGGPGLIALGQGVEQAGASAAQAQRFLLERRARQEVTDASVSLTELGTQLATDLDERAKRWKAGDTPLSDGFLGIVKSRLDQLRGDEGEAARFETQAGASTFQTHAAQLTQHFAALARQADAKLAGDAAIQQHDALVDGVGNFLQTHPAYFALRREEVAQTINDPNGIYGPLPQTAKDTLVHKADERLAVSAVQGLIRKTPNLALERLRDPNLKQDEQYGWIAQYVPQEKMNQLVNMAETEVRGLEVEAARLEADRNRQRIVLARESEAGLVEKLALHMEDPKQPMLSARDVLDSNLMAHDPEKAKAMLGLIHAWAKEDPHRPIHTDPGTMRALVRDIHRPDGDPKKLIDNTRLYQAYDKGLLSFQDLKNLNTEFNDARTPEGQKFGQTKEKFIASMAPLIDHSNPMMGKIDRSGKKNVYEFEQSVNRKVEEYRKAGKDIYSLFDPESTDFMGKPERLKPFQKHTMDSIREFSEGMRNATAPAPAVEPVPDKARKPGETPQQYLDRMKKP